MKFKWSLATWQHARGPTKCHKLWGLRGLGCPGSRTYIYPPAPVPSHSTANLRLCVFTRVWQSSPHVLSSHILGLTSHVHPCRLLGFPLTESIQTSQDSRPNMPPFLHLYLYTQNMKGQIFYLTPTQFQLLDTCPHNSFATFVAHNFEFSTNISTRIHQVLDLLAHC